MQPLRRYKRKSPLRQSPGCLIYCVDFVEEVQRQMIPVAGGDDLLFVTEVIEDVGGVWAILVNIRIASFVFGGDIGDMVRGFEQLVPAIVRLAHNALIGLGDVM